MCSIENLEFIVSERVQVNPDNSRAMSVLTFLLFKLNALQTKIVLFHHNPVSRGTNLPIKQSEFVQCMKFE